MNQVLSQPHHQVFHVPLEERRYKDNSQFGEGEEAKVCLDIMQRTGAHIELSLAKDQGLSIMVTGKLDSVMKARKEIVARLQTQVKSQQIFVHFACLRLNFWDTECTAGGFSSLDLLKMLHIFSSVETIMQHI